MAKGRVKGIPLLVSVLVIAVLAISVYIWGKQYIGSRVEKDFYLAKSLFKEGKYGEAVNKFDKVIKSNPQGTFAPESQYHIGSAYKNLKMLEEARQAYSLLTSQYAASEWADDAQLEIGYILIAQEKLDLALQELQKLSEEHPFSEETGKALYEAGKIYLSQKKYSQALQNFQAVIEGYAKIADKAQLGKADSLRAREEWIKAIEAYLNALNHYPQSKIVEEMKGEIFYNLGLCHYNLGDYKSAIQEFDKVLAHPDRRKDEEALSMKEATEEKMAAPPSSPSQPVPEK